MTKAYFIKGLLLWVLIALAIASWIGGTGWWARYYRLSKSAAIAQGIVTTKEPRNHQIVRYSFTVAGEDYTGVSHAGLRTLPFDLINPGDAVLVTYAPEDPQSSCICDPRTSLRWESIVIAIASVFGSALIMLSIHVYRVEQRRSQLRQT